MYKKADCRRDGILCGHRRSISHTATGSVKVCHYLLDTGKKRGCPPGKECIHYTREHCRMQRENVYIETGR